MPIQNMSRAAKTSVGIATLAAAALAGAIFTISPASGEGGREESESARSPISVISLLGPSASQSGEAWTKSRSTAPEAATDLPAYVDLSTHGTGGITSSSLRFLGSEEASEFWIGTDAADEICVITILPRQEVYASACNNADSVEEFGLWLGVADSPLEKGNQEITALLLPDSAAPSEESRALQRSSSPWRQVSPNLVVADTRDVKDSGAETFERVDGEGDAVTFAR